MDKWEIELRERLIAKRGPYCEICGLRYATEVNHCLVHDRKRLHKLLTVEENLQLVCRECHAKYGHTKENKKLFYEKQLKRGYNITKWYDSLPLKINDFTERSDYEGRK